jgi:hypothetical protein
MGYLQFPASSILYHYDAGYEAFVPGWHNPLPDGLDLTKLDPTNSLSVGDKLGASPEERSVLAI